MIVEEYQSAWAVEFERLRGVLAARLGSLARAIHHVGSTSVPGMSAKPTLDVDIEIAPETPLAELSAALAALGYLYEGERGVAGRHAYRRSSPAVPHTDPPRSWVNQHLYVCASGARELERHLHFRDALVASPELREQYRSLKRACVARAADGQVATYQAAKDELGREFFARVLALPPLAERINRASALLEDTERRLACGEIDEAGWYREVTGVITPAYLSQQDPRAQSGNSGDEAKWRYSRSLLTDAIDRDGAFLDVGCANGYLMESMQRWCAERGVALEPFGLDIAPELAELARRRLPHWSERIFVGNASDWLPPRRFDFVRTGLEYVPRRRRRDLIEWLLLHVVSPGGRLIIGVTNEARASLHEPSSEDLVRFFGQRIAGRSERPHPVDPRVVYRVFWIERH